MSYKHIYEYVEAMALVQQGLEAETKKCFELAGHFYFQALFLISDARKKTESDQEREGLTRQFNKLSDKIVSGAVGKYYKVYTAKDIEPILEAETKDREAKLERSEKASHLIQKIRMTLMIYQHINEYVEAMALGELAREAVAEKRFEEALDFYGDARHCLCAAIKNAKSDQEKEGLESEFNKLDDECSNGPVGQYCEEEMRKEDERIEEAKAITLKAKLEKSLEAKKELEAKMNKQQLSNIT